MTSPTAHLRWLPLWLATGWLLVAVVVYLSLMAPPADLDLSGGDKLTHLLAYGVLMWWFAQIYDTRRSRAGFALGFAALGIVLECLQAYTGYRTFELYDMAANAAGVALGWIAAPPRTRNFLSRIESIVLT